MQLIKEPDANLRIAEHSEVELTIPDVLRLTLRE